MSALVKTPEIEGRLSSTETAVKKRFDALGFAVQQRRVSLHLEELHATAL